MRFLKKKKYTIYNYIHKQIYCEDKDLKLLWRAYQNRNCFIYIYRKKTVIAKTIY